MLDQRFCCHPEGSGVTDGGARWRTAPWQDKYKNWSPLVDILIISIRQFFCVFRSVFVFLSSMDIHDIQRFTIIS